MKIYNVGPEKYDPSEGEVPFGTEWVVYWYESGDYDGSGYAVAKVGNKLYSANLGHCSCFGPWEAHWETPHQSAFDKGLSISEWMNKNKVSDNALDPADENAVIGQVRKLVSDSPIPIGCSIEIQNLYTAWMKGEDCGFAIKDALLDAGYPKEAEYFS